MVLKRGSKGEEVKELQQTLHIYPDGIFGKLTEEAVREFQRVNRLKVDGIAGDMTWAKLKGSALARSKRKITEIILHCSATREGKDFTVADIESWHKKRGFTTIGYHYVIYRDGSLHEGRDIDIAGAHCTGHNTHSVGICYIGGLSKTGAPKDTRTDAQKKTLLNTIKELKKLYPAATVHGHCEFANKACPCFDVKEYADIQNAGL